MNEDPRIAIYEAALREIVDPNVTSLEWGDGDWATERAKRALDEASKEQTGTLEQRALEILEPAMKVTRFEGDKGFLFDATDHATWFPGDNMATLDGGFSADQLEAIAWWMRNKDRAIV